VKDARQALALFSAAVLGDPARQLDLVGVTGTNGKTTTTYLIDSALRAAGETVGLLGTVEYRIGRRIAEAVRTTPESSDLQALFREMVDAGCRRAVLEVSSHSLVLERVHGLAFKVAVFTNLTRDHLDFHGDMDAYFAAKRILFERLLREDGHAIVNLDDDRAPELLHASRGKAWTYSLANPKADLFAEEMRLGLDRTRLRRARRWGARARDVARRPLQRPERAGGARRRASRSACRPTRRSAGSRRCRACPAGWRRSRRARTSRCWSTTPTPTTRSRTCSRRCARCRRGA
jgi:UDP-N-acetylmuramyl tripeptide synthase